MTEQEFYEKVKTEYGSRGVKQAKKMMADSEVQKICTGGENTTAAVMLAFLSNKQRARAKFTPRKYKKGTT